MNPRPLLRVSSLNAWYGQAQVLFDLNLHVLSGEVLGLLGPNGAGKSSTLKAIMGLMRRVGQVEFLGRELSGLATHQIARLGLGFVPEDRRIFPDLTVLENLEVGHQPPRLWPDGRAAHHWCVEELFELFPNLAQMQHRLGAQMSGGEQQMLTVARSLMGNPLMLLLDEPSEGVAPLLVEQMARMVLSLKANGVSVLLSEQNPVFVKRVCDRKILIDQGQMERVTVAE